MNLAASILFLPLVSAVFILLFLKRQATLAAWLSTGSAFLALVLTLALSKQPETTHTLFSWADLGSQLNIHFSLAVTGIGKGMMIVVALVGALVHLYSLGYMKDDPGKARYFAGLSLFMFSMTGIVFSSNLILMFVFWELVGVSSWLLIGHWFHKDAPPAAANKAFIVNRIGDFGFLIGILMVWALTGTTEIADLKVKIIDIALLKPELVTITALLIFCGAVGKSAQLPLHVWLPDAMEGPTPVSALIHAATMVAAGVYMLARVFFLVDASPTAAEVIMYVGIFTSLLAALMALQQNDIKKILAFSTLSQLGYMVMAVGLLAPDAAMFHLYTHAFFKALLFLGAGAVIYACHHEQDIWKMGGLAKKMPITFTTFGIGMLALAALPFVTSGFYSKEYILEAASHSPDKGVFLLTVIVAFLTPLYMMRLFVVAFFGAPRSRDAEHAAEVPRVMRWPLMILAAFAIMSAWISDYLHVKTPAEHASTFVMGISFVTVFGGLFLGWFLYKGRTRDFMHIQLFSRQFYINDIYNRIIKKCHDTLAWIIDAFDSLLIDHGLVRASGKVAAGAGRFLRRFQSGNLQGYALLSGAGFVAVLYLALFRK